MHIKNKTISFLKQLRANNNREWFKNNKEAYNSAYANANDFLETLREEMEKHDDIGKTKLYRVYRDVRFSKDKTPYNSDLRMSLQREGALNRGGYFLKITPEETTIACGFWKPESKDLKLIRDHIAFDDSELRKILNAESFKETFNILDGEKVKTSPKGYSIEHPAIDLLRYKQFLVSKTYPAKSIEKDTFIQTIVNDYQSIRPFFNYMSYILNHDLNGESLL